MTKLVVVKAHNNILEEESIQIILYKNNNEYEASGLFFKWNDLNEWDDIVTLKELELTDEINAEELINKIIELKKEFNLEVYDTTFKTLMHWQYITGVTNQM